MGPQFLGVILCCREFCNSLSAHTGAPEIKILLIGNRPGNGSKSCLVCCVIVVYFPVMSDSLQPHGLQPIRYLCPWTSPGKKTGVGCCSLLQGIFPTRGSNSGLLHCRQILYHLSHQGSPYNYVLLTICITYIDVICMAIIAQNP